MKTFILIAAILLMVSTLHAEIVNRLEKSDYIYCQPEYNIRYYEKIKVFSEFEKEESSLSVDIYEDGTKMGQVENMLEYQNTNDLGYMTYDNDKLDFYINIKKENKFGIYSLILVPKNKDEIIQYFKCIASSTKEK